MNRENSTDPSRGFAGRIEAAGSVLQSDPAAERHDSCRVLCSGFIANRAALIRDLQVRAPTDAAVFSAAYRRWGSGLQRHVFGEYSIALLDEMDGALLLTTDALGLCPLFYAETDGGLVFASRLEQVVAITDRYELDETYIGEYLSHGQHFGWQTVYRGVRRLPCGHSALWRSGRLALSETWSLAGVQPLRKTAGEYDEQLRMLLKEAVTSYCVGRSWAELSGGLDSSTIVCVAAAAGVDGLEALSKIYPEQESADEQAWIGEVVSRTGVPWNKISGVLPFSELPDRWIAEPSRITLVWRLVKEYERITAARGVETVLSGLGGDQVFFGDDPQPLHLADRLAGLDIRGTLAEIRQWQQAEPDKRSVGHLLFQNAVLPLLSRARGRSLTVVRTPLEQCPWIDTAFARRAGVKAGSIPGPSQAPPSVAGQYFYERVSDISLTSGQAWNQFVHGFRYRYPLLYLPLVEFMYALPSEQKSSPGRDRVVQRRALSGILPERIRLREGKKGPDEAYFEGLRRNREFYAQLTEKPRIVARGYVIDGLWQQAVSRARFGRVVQMPYLLAAASLEIWLRQTEKLARPGAPALVAAPEPDRAS
jgi:asparagine synthase (glutamine-hydrolysing)